MKRRKDGRLQASFVVENPLTGERLRRYAYGYTEAELAAEKVRKLKEAGDLSAYIDGRITFADWCEECLQSKLANKSINEVTIESYRMNIKNHILPCLPKDIHLVDVKIFHIKNILQKIKKQRTREYTYTILNTIFSEAVFETLIGDNPCTHVRKPKAETEHAAFITPETFQKIMAAVKGTEFFYIFMLGFYTGCRRGELCALRWSSFDKKEKTLKIAGALKKAGLQGLHEGTTKSRFSVRILPLSDAAVVLLQSWQSALAGILASKALPWDSDGYIFRSPKNWARPLSPASITSRMGIIKRRLGLPPRTCMHSFRHTHATNLAEQNISAKKLQMHMGHASAAFTLDTYVHNTPDMRSGFEPIMEQIEQEYKLGI